MLEKAGVPSASIVTDVFEITGRAMAEQWGLPAYRFLVMPHPIANLTEAQLDQRAREIAPQVVKLLLQGQEGPSRGTAPAPRSGLCGHTPRSPRHCFVLSSRLALSSFGKSHARSMPDPRAGRRARRT
ncbi:MAG TPA: hypothetical protein VII47_15105 [Actinomycetota bacterium]